MVGRSSNRGAAWATGRPPIEVIGIIGGMPAWAGTDAVGMAPLGVTVAALGADDVPVHAVGTDNAPAVVA